MIVRCGQCRSEFEVQGEGLVQCPACGASNQVRSRPEEPGFVTPPPPPEPDAPSPRATCEACGFSFIVGTVTEAPCPMCGHEVSVGPEGGDK